MRYQAACETFNCNPQVYYSFLGVSSDEVTVSSHSWDVLAAGLDSDAMNGDHTDNLVLISFSRYSGVDSDPLGVGMFPFDDLKAMHDTWNQLYETKDASGLGRRNRTLAGPQGF